MISFYVQNHNQIFSLANKSQFTSFTLYIEHQPTNTEYDNSYNYS